MLSGDYLPSHEFPKDDHRRRWSPEKREADWRKVQCLQNALKDKKLPLTQAALEFALSFDVVSSVIPGAKTRTQVLANVAASLEPVLEREDHDRLQTLYAREEIFRQGLNPR
jgi:aryl-alcohol dehydrogenase-like predicted oxidoreductase